MIAAMLPSRLLIRIVAGLAVLLAVLALSPYEPSRVAWVSVAILLALLAAVTVDLIRSISVWRRAPLGMNRRLPQAFAVGVPVTVQVTLDNEGETRCIGEFFECADPEFAIQGMPMQFDIGPRQRALLEVSLTPHARGMRRFERGQIRLRSSWGLLDFNLRIGVAEERRVFPNFTQQARYAWLAGEQRLPTAGIKSVQRRGAGTDFDQLVDYQAGDQIRHIDWKATRKHDRPIVRKFRDERDQNVIILLDCGRRMRADDVDLGIGASHFDQALNALMLLAFVALSHGDAVGAMTFGNAEGMQKRFAPRKGRNALNGLMAALADVEPTPTFSDYERAAADLLHGARKRGLVVIITNSRNEDAPELASALKLLRSRHAVVLANLREQIVSVIAEQPLSSPERALESAAAIEYTQARAILLARVAQDGVFTIDCEPQRLAVELVNRYTVLKRTGSI